MALVLKQVRRCDGACCRESPRFPNIDGTDCRYRITGTDGKETSGCGLMVDSKLIPKPNVKCELIGWEDRSAEEVFTETCVNWPQNIPVTFHRPDKTGGCCWQFVEETA